MGDNLYISFWESIIENVISEIQSGKTKFSLDVSGLAEFGNRQSYYSNFRIRNGILENSHNAQATGRDFYQVLSGKDYFGSYLIDKIIEVKITRNLNLEIEMDNKIGLEFFSQEDISQLAKFAAQKRTPGNKEMDATYQHLKTTYSKIEYWGQQVQQRSFPDGEIHVIKKPTNQANKFEEYQWVKIYPTNKHKEWKTLAYTLTLSNSEGGFVVKIDTVGLGDNDPIRQKYFEYRGEFRGSKIVKLFDYDDVLNEDWGYLISNSCNAIKELSDDYEKLLEILNIRTHETDDLNIVSKTETSQPLNQILYGPPGTGKTYNSIDLAVDIAVGKSPEHSENKILFDELRQDGQIEFVTFHQNYTYEDFIIGLKPDLAESAQLKFKRSEGIFYRLSKRAEQNFISSNEQSSEQKPFEEVLSIFLKPLQERDEEIEVKMASGKTSYWITDINPSNLGFRKQSGGTQHSLSMDTMKELYEGSREFTSGLSYYYNPLIENLRKLGYQPSTKVELKNFVLVIDEINRANISKVFGELITLLEPDKRIGQENELKVTIPNTDKEFGVPPNLYVIGTMNTADKSIALVDIALRRRFEFVGMYPEYNRIDNPQAAELLRQINKAVFAKKGSADYLIGHAYFMNDNSIEDTLQKKVIPLLSEYFMGKNRFVSEVFTDTDWYVNYNEETYSWDITEK